MSADRQSPAFNILVAHETESGLKLLRFLERRTCLPRALLQRWLRTGQIRLNGRRVKHFARVQTDDGVRLPPFALDMFEGKKTLSASAVDRPVLPPYYAVLPDSPENSPFLASIGHKGDIWALYKAPGLPTHGGTGHSDSLAARLAARYAGAPFIPVPAHRLDKDTSGVLLIAASYRALQKLHGALRERRMLKEYLAWARGGWPFEGIRLLRHDLRKQKVAGFEKVRVALPLDGRASSREALCFVRALKIRPEMSLLQIRTLTGRTHQIRAQLAALGHPVLGDAKYGADSAGRMFLHAARVVLPDGTVFACLPPWRGRKAVEKLPDVMPGSKNSSLPF
ncbi:MAG: RluA family pseudouridine synthase [Desulfovibrio sp.]|jgi:23S rRNA pseudouridine955/2504/2580 synthase|nr:RluA family pseudouridine synthase [Desulfovibrio sp.]